MYNPFNPKPAPPGFAKDQPLLPDKTASWPSRLVFHWLRPFLDVGFSRPLEKDDLWELPPSKQTAELTDRVERVFYARCPPEQRPLSLRKPLSKRDKTATFDADSDEWVKKGDKTEANDAQKSQYDSSLFQALHSAFFVRWWIAGILHLIGDTLKTTTPLVTKVLLTWLTDSYIYHNAPGSIPKPKGIGYGIGIGLALFAMQESSSIMTNHFTMITMTNGMMVRGALIGNIFRKSLRLSGRARLEHSVGQITTMISTDATRLDRFSMFVHSLWVSPVQVILGVGLLLGNLGYSALVGLGVLILGFPIQFISVRIMFQQRQKGVKFTDSRLRLTTEVLNGVRLLKLYGWEAFYIQQLELLRRREISTLRKTALARSSLISSMIFVPILAAILSFITYSLSGHELNVAIIFSSLQLFNIIRMPLTLFPMVLTFLSDALVALGRIGGYLTAEELPEPYLINHDAKYAVDIEGDFAWEVAGNIEENKFDEAMKYAQSKAKRRSGGPRTTETKTTQKDKKRESTGKKVQGEGPILPTTASGGDDNLLKEKPDEKPFELNNLSLKIERGSFVAIVGRVGSGKSSLLQALLGEMRKMRGDVTFGGTVSYVPQRAWIQNATVRDNISFGLPLDQQRFEDVICACNLQHDLELLPHGAETEIGEKGINLSGGQKARVSLARAAYSDSDIVLLDDPLSAVDAYVGKAILEHCILTGPLADRTRILVTHSLHVLDKADYIYVMDDGVIVEQGKYESLMKDSATFSRLMEEYGSLQVVEKDPAQAEKAEKPEKSKAEPGDKEGQAALMQVEERYTGSVTWSVYANYLRFAGSILWAPFLVGLLVLNQGASVGNNLFLGFWTATSISGFKQGDYMAVYAALGAAQAIFTFILSYSFTAVALLASLNLFSAGIRAVLRSPTSFFDTTPMGRILSRFSKDQDTLDTQISMTMFQFMNTFMSILGTVALVFYTFPYLGIMFVPMTIIYYGISVYYRRTSVETKRIDSLMRSALYASYSETLTGLSTIRAYRTQESAVRNAEQGLDLENRAYYMTIAIQRWLAVRLDFLGNLLVLGISLFAAGFRDTVNPSKVGVVLSYALSITQVFSDMINQFAQNEQNMNAVERLLVYTELPSEGDLTTPNDPPASWPTKGEVTFSNVKFAYREGLPLVLKDVSFQIRSGEKVGIVGRTGAGKSSLIQALFRIAEIQSGKIEIDGHNTRDMGLSVLRSRLALVPQDSTLFLGTLRENLDPQLLRTDAELISVLQRAWLLPRDGVSDPAAEAKFSLDSTVGDDGANFSVGERQLLALCRALVKNSRIIVLDEATSSVDVETDAKLQRTIQTEFASSTLLCIAHRLNTIAYYDRVLVMEDGKVAEFDTVLNLFDKEDSIFRSLCNEASLSRQDISRIRAEAGLND